MFFLPKKFSQEGGAVPLIVLVASVGLLAFLVITNTFNFKDTLFNNLFPKPASNAATFVESVNNGYGDFKVGKWPDSNWRPYADYSPFNQPVPANPKIAANSSAVVSRWFVFKPDDMSVGLSTSGSTTYKGYDHPVYFSQFGDPSYIVRCHPPYWTGTCKVEGATVQVPTGAKPENGTDGSLAVIDQSTDTEYDFWQVEDPSKWSDGYLDVSWGGKTSVKGDGLGGDATASLFGLAAGNIRAAELVAGNIDHALFIVIHCDNGSYVYPASGLGTKCTDTTGAPPMGARFYLNMTDAEIQATGLASWKQILMRAMAKYGMFMGDTGSGNWEIKRESGFTYTSFLINSVQASDPLVDFAVDYVKNNPTVKTDIYQYQNFYILKFPELPNYLSKISMIDPCVTKVGTGDCLPASSSTPTSSSSATSVPTSSGTNLIANPGCEDNANGWTSSNATLAVPTTNPHSGSTSCQVVYSGTGSYYSLDDFPDTVTFSSSNPAVVGSVYTATAWVRSENAVGRTVQLAVRQKGGAKAISNAYSSNTKTLSNIWQQLSVSTSVDVADRANLDVYVYENSPAALDSMQVDDICLAKGSSCSTAITPTPTPTIAPTPSSTPTPLPTVAPAGGTGDVAVPTVSITSPVNGSTLTGLVTINATATDTGGYGNTGTGISKVDFYLDNVFLSTVTNLAPLAGTPFIASTIWDTTHLTQGSPHTIFAKAYDNATPALNISSPSASISVTIADTTPPTVTLTKPTFGATVSGLVDISADASDNVGVTKVEFYVDGLLVSTSSISPYTYSWDSTGVINGSHSLNVKAYDAVGNTSSAGVSVDVSNRETIPPTAPTNLTASAFSYNQVNLSWTASTDNVGVTGYFVVRDGKTIATVSTNSYQDISNPPTYFVTENTSYTYQVIAFDGAGNYSLASDPASVTTPLSPDIQAPSIPTNLTASAFSYNQVNLSWTASTDNRTGAIKYDVYRITTLSTILLAKEITDTSYGDTGLTASTTYSYFVKAKDATGNTSDPSKTVSVITQAPPVTKGNISGTVKSQSGTGISYANVSIKDEQGATSTYTTDSVGNYSILNILAGTIPVTYSAGSYVSQKISVAITAGLTTTQDVILISATSALDNLVKNPGCETDTNNWIGYHSALSITTASSHSGSASCLLKYSGSGGYYSIDDNPSTVLGPLVGRTYTVSAYVKSSNSNSKPAIITLRQRKGSQSSRNYDSAPVNLNSTTSWQKASVSTTIDTGTTELEVYIHQDKASKGDTFQVDDINLNLQ